MYILDIIDTKFYKPQEKKISKPRPKNVCIISFENKGMNLTHINKIFRSAEVTSALPVNFQTEEDIPISTMRLSKTVRNKILNYKETVNSLHVEIDEDVVFIRNSFECNCKESEFCDPHHGHIVTGDLRIVSDDKLRKLLSKGPNYRENVTINYKKCKTSIHLPLKSAIDTFSTKYKINKQEFNNWYNTIILKVSERTNHLQSKFKPQQTKQILKDRNALNSLHQLHDRFVLVPIDKASNNVAIICKKFYVHRLLQEVWVSENKSNTYILSSRNKLDIINNNMQSICINLFLIL